MLENLLLLKDKLPSKSEQKQILCRLERSKNIPLIISLQFESAGINQSKCKNSSERAIYELDGRCLCARSVREFLHLLYPASTCVVFTNTPKKFRKTCIQEVKPASADELFDALKAEILQALEKSRKRKILIDFSNCCDAQILSLALAALNFCQASFIQIAAFTSAAPAASTTASKLATKAHIRLQSFAALPFATRERDFITAAREFAATLARPQGAHFGAFEADFKALSQSLCSANLPELNAYYTAFCAKFAATPKTSFDYPAGAALRDALSSLGLANLCRCFRAADFRHGAALAALCELSRMYFERHFYLNAAAVLFEAHVRTSLAVLLGVSGYSFGDEELLSAWRKAYCASKAKPADVAEQSALAAFRRYFSHLSRIRAKFAHLWHDAAAVAALERLIKSCNAQAFVQLLEALEDSELGNLLRAGLKFSAPIELNGLRILKKVKRKI